MTIYGSDYLFTGNDNLDLVNVSQANQVRAYLSENVTDEDIVFGSPALNMGVTDDDAVRFSDGACL